MDASMDRVGALVLGVPPVESRPVLDALPDKLHGSPALVHGQAVQ